MTVRTCPDRDKPPAGPCGLSCRQRIVLMTGVPALLVLVLHPWLSPVSWPEPGVVCDRVAGFCADAWGMSETLTARYLGERQALAVRDRRDQGGSMSVLHLSAGIHCDTDLRQCWQDAGHLHPDPVATARLFHAGLPAAEAGSPLLTGNK